MDGRVEIHEIARGQRARVRSTNLHWPGLAGPFTETCRFTRAGIRVDTSTSGDWLRFELRVEVGVCFALGEPDRVLPANVRIGDIGVTRAFIVKDRPPNESTRAWLARPESHALVNDLALAREERVLVALNGITAALRPSGADSDLVRLDVLLRLAAALPAGDVGGEPPPLPPSLAHLEALAEQWATGDDDDRSCLVAGATDDQLAELWRSVEPELSSIDALFERHGEPSPDPVLVAGRLAEAAHEARIELERRRSR